jgi:hypothetical protein
VLSAAIVWRRCQARSAAQIASVLFHRHGRRVAERTIRAQLLLCHVGLHREALRAAPKAFSREALSFEWSETFASVLSQQGVK